jgi:hypothetical protein
MGGNGASSRIDPDTRGVQWTVVGLVGLLGLTSFAVSFRALHDVAAWAGIGPGLQWAVPVFIDGAILTYALAVLVHRSRGESVWPSWVSLAVFTAMSVAANAAHAVAAPQEQWWQTLVGASLAALAPLGVFAATEQMARLVVLRPQDREAIVPIEYAAPETREADEAPAAPEVEPVQEQVPATAARPVEQPQHVIADDRQDEPVATVDPTPAQEPQEVEGGTEEPEAAAPAREPQEELPAPEKAPEPSTTTAEAVDDEEPTEEDFVAWVQERRRQGEPVTGPTAGSFLGVSERTGRNRIKELRKARPELFEGDAA